MRLANLALGIVSAVSLLAIASPAQADAAAGASARESCEARLGGSLNAALELPSNAPALLVMTSNYQTMAAELVTGDIRVPFQGPALDANGIMALTLPSNAVGVHRVVIDARCSGYSDGVKETPLKLLAPVPFPTKVGTLVQAAPQTRPGVTTLDLELGTNVREFLPVIQFSTTIGGVKEVARSGAQTTERISFTAKTGAVCVENGALHREKRTVKITVGAAIAGVAKPLEEASFDVTVDCGAIKWTDADDFASGNGNATNTTTAPGAQGSSTAGGCSAAPGAATPVTAGSFAALGLAALVAMRRRRR